MSENNVKEVKMQPTSASMWRKARLEGYTVQLPSGLFATIRPVALDQLVKTGLLPDLLSPIAARSLWAETESDDIAKDPEMNKRFLELIDLIVPMAMMIPAVVENPNSQKEEIKLEDIDFLDKVGIFNLATQPAEMLKTFRDQQKERLSALHNSKDN